MVPPPGEHESCEPTRPFPYPLPATRYGEAAGGGARAFAEAAQQGWERARDGRPVDGTRWAAMRGVLTGVMPEWRAEKGGEREGQAKAKEVATVVGQMQVATEERLAAHRKRASRAASWVEQREQQRPLLTLLLRAWRGAVTSGRGVQVPAADAPLGRERLHDRTQ